MHSKADGDSDLRELQDEMDLEHAVPRKGRPHGVVVSVRLDENEAHQLRVRAQVEQRTLSQVVREAVRRYLGAPASERGAAALPHTGGGGYWATGQISIQLRGQQLVVVATDMVEDVESGRPSSTMPARLLVSR